VNGRTRVLSLAAWLLVVVGVGVVMGLTTSARFAFRYDGPSLARINVHEIEVAEASPPQLSVAKEGAPRPPLEARGTSTTSPRSFIATEAADANVAMGRKGSEMLVESGTNVPGVVNGRAYSAHAFDQMQGRGIMPSVVDDTIATGVPAASRGATTVYYGAGNNISVVVNAEGKVVTVSYGDLRP
jgi:hypothetical protein